MKGNTVRYTKFTFSNYDLAYKVRGNMLNALVPYDVNHNGLFEQPQIVKALVQILNENENQIRYVISNVFRYDRDNDKAVTYEQFVNFAVEQHFGEMAIQRLHRNQVYARGKERMMNVNQFEITLNESLKYIDSQGTRQEYQQLFREIDLDQDGWIKYEDYFLFLREYFGSQSVAANQKEPPKAQPQPQTHGSEIQYPEERFARLLYSQLKISVMQHDLKRKLNLSRTEVGSVLKNVFKIPENEIQQLVQLIMDSSQNIQYEKFMKVMVPFYFCEYDVHRNNINLVNEEDFVFLVKQASYFVRVKPSQSVLRTIFRRSDLDGRGILQKIQYINTLGNILENYQFDRRGTAHHRSNDL